MKKLASNIFPLTLSAFFVAFGVVFLQVFSGGTAFASTYSTSTHHVTKIIVPMHVVKTSTHGSSPDNTVNGTCGSIEFYIDDDGGGAAEFWEYVDSSQGIIESLSYTVSWTNWSTNRGSQFGNSFLFPGNPWDNIDYKNTGAGLVTGSLTATDVVGLGEECQGNASDSNYITN